MTRAFFDTKSSLTQHGRSNGRKAAERIGGLLVLAFLACWCAANWASTLGYLPRFYVDLPLGDYWRVAYWLHSIQTWHFGYLWSQHNEHRIVFPDIVFALDVLLMHGRRVLPIMVSFACYFACWLLLAAVWLHEESVGRPGAIAAGLMAGIVIGWKGSALVLADPFLIQWTLLSLGVLASLVALTRVNGNRSTLALVICIAAGVVATYSSGNGLLLWPVLVAVGIALRLTKRQLLILFACSALACGLYFVGYQPTGTLQMWQLLVNPSYAIQFVCAFVSMPFGDMKSPHFGVYMGLVHLLLASALLFAWFRRRRPTVPKAAIVCVGWYVFAILSGLLIAGGRMDPTDPTYTSAKPARYLILPLLTWGVTVSLLVATASVRRWRVFSATVCCCLLSILLWLAFHKLRWWFQIHSQIYSDDQFAELSIEDGLSDPIMLRQIFPDASFVNGCLPGLKAAHLSIYYRSEGGAIGKRLAQVAPDTDGQAAGTATHVRRLISGLEIVGWAQSVAVREVLLTDDHERIIGIGSHLANGLPWRQVSRDISPDLVWVAFVPDRLARGPFRVFVTDGHGKRSAALPETYVFPPEASDMQLTTREDPGPWFALDVASE